MTDAAGAFELDWIPEGPYSITVYADGAAVPSVDFDVRGGETARHDVALRARQDGDAIITGAVTTGYDGQDYISVDEPSDPAAVGEPIHLAAETTGIAVVMAFPLGQTEPAPPYIAVTRRDGSYELSGLPEGDYVLMCQAPGHTGTYYGDTYAPDMAQKVHVDAGGLQSGIDFRLSYMPVFLAAEESRGDGDSAPADGAAGVRVTGAGVSVYGHVADDGGKPIANATLYLLDANERPVASVQTARDGSFELAFVTPGEYRVFAGKPGYAGSYNGDKHNFASAEALLLTDGQTQVNLVLSTRVMTAVTEETGPAVPRDMALEQNYPNPFNPETKISFTVQASGPTTLRIYDVLGQQVAVPFDRFAEAGSRYDVVFRAAGLGAGVYYYTLMSAGQRVSRPMMLVK